MCCLFGILDYGHKLSRKEKAKILSTLSVACEERGTDATGIAYNSGGALKVYKRPLPAHLLWFRIFEDTNVVMGHTRMTTQGSERFNQNNHPFFGQAGDVNFALAHNGVLSNDKRLRRQHNLPATKIETDSYIAVQLLEASGELSFSSLASMAEKLDGSFAITVMTDSDELYFVKGDKHVFDIDVPKGFDNHLCDTAYVKDAWVKEEMAKAISAAGARPGMQGSWTGTSRTAYVSQMQAMGVDLATIQSIVGHADLDMTRHYLHVQEPVRQAAAERFSEVFGE